MLEFLGGVFFLNVFLVFTNSLPLCVPTNDMRFVHANKNKSKLRHLRRVGNTKISTHKMGLKSLKL